MNLAQTVFPAPLSPLQKTNKFLTSTQEKGKHLAGVDVRSCCIGIGLKKRMNEQWNEWALNQCIERWITERTISD